MKQQKNNYENSTGITLIALVISIIILLILSGVSISATVGDNGVITKAQNAKIYNGMALLEEYLNQEYVDLYGENQNNPYSTDLDLVRHNRSDWFYKPSQTGLSYVLIDGYVYYLIQKENLPEEIQKNLVGGDANGKTYYDYSHFKDVYGVRTDLKVYYCADGLSSLIGAEDEHLEDSAAREAIASSSSSGLANFLSNKYSWVKTDADGNVLSDGLSSLKELTIDDSNVTSLEELYNFSALQTLYLKNLTLESLEGLEYCTSLTYLSIYNCSVADYTQIASLDNLKYLYLQVTTQANVNSLVSALSEASNMTKVEYLGIYDSGTNVTDLSGIFGTNATTNIASSIRNSVKYLYAYNNRITSCSLNGYNILYEIKLNDNPALESVNISSNTLWYLYLYSCSALENVTANVPNLYYLHTKHDTSLTSLDNVTVSTNLHYAYLYNNPISNLDFLESSTYLYCLDIRYTKVTNLNNVPVGQLRYLYASDCSNLGKGLDVTSTTNADNSITYNVLTKASTNVFAPLANADYIYYVELNNDKYIAYLGYFANKSTLQYLYTDGCTNLSTISEVDTSTIRLDLSNQTLTVIKFRELKSYTNIKYLNLSNLTLTGFASGETYNTVINEVLSSLTSLETLKLYGISELTDITFVSSTTNLKELNLDGTKVSTHKTNSSGTLEVYETGLKQLNSVTSLYTLVLPNIDTIDFSKIQTAISNLCHTSIEAISTDSNNITTYTTYSSIQGAVTGSWNGYWGLRCSNATSLGTFSSCTNLTSLLLVTGAGSGTIDLSNNSNMKYIALTRTNSAAMNLKLPDSGNYHLVLWNLWALNITGGKGCKYLYTNDLAASTEAQFWGYFSGMQNSTALKMAVFNLDNDGMNYTFNGMSVFSNCTNLEYLRIEGNSAKTTESDISSISTMTGLKKFEITNGGVVYSLPDLSALTQLKEISVTSSRLMYIDGIANCTSLQTLRLSENAIFDLSALENLSNLTYLDLRNNSIQSTGTSITNGYFDNVEILNTLKTTHNKLTTCCLGGNAIDRTSLTWCSF